MTQKVLFRIWVIGSYLVFGLPARSRFGEGRCLEFGASPRYAPSPMPYAIQIFCLDSGSRLDPKAP
jgi:hypothetical protein